MQVIRILHVRLVAPPMTASSASDGELGIGAQAMLRMLIADLLQAKRRPPHSLQYPSLPCSRNLAQASLNRLQCGWQNLFPLACNCRASQSPCVNVVANAIRLILLLAVHVTVVARLPKKALSSMCVLLDVVFPWRLHMRRRGAKSGLVISRVHLAQRCRFNVLQAHVHSAHPSSP